MPTKLARKQIPSGVTPGDFKYMGRPAKDQGDFGSDVGIADMACVNQFGESNNAKYYHGGVVQANAQWFVYLEWGRMKAAKSWNGGFGGGDYQFVQCSGEAEARAFFTKQMNSKNTKRLERKTIGGVDMWAGKSGKDGYLVQDLATRQKGLPDAYTIKDDSGLTSAAPTATKKAPTKKAAKPSRIFQPEVLSLANALVGGVKTYTRSMAAASGVTPTMATIERVRNDFIPAALERIKAVGTDVDSQVKDQGLIDVSKMVMAIVPRPIPGKGMEASQAILNAGNIMVLQQDLDAFEAALRNEDFEAASDNTGVNPDALLNANLTWLNPRSEGKWIIDTFNAMTRRRHHNARGMRVLNVFDVQRPDRDARFKAAVKDLAARRRGQSHGHVMAELQPKHRPDLGDLGTDARDANVFLGIHGTRSVNVSPIMGSHFRLPKSLSGVHVTGAAFGHGVYFADDWGKSSQYVGFSGASYGSGGGIRGRGYFMFLCDVAGGQFYYPNDAWGIGAKCPGGGDTVYAHPSRVRTLQNNEYVTFHPDRARIRYLVELSL